ncbi:MAG TPA: MFS transporter [Anaerolineaceae bacterium]|nr:MFS transporter [Anaerolineaceae bacterium]
MAKADPIETREKVDQSVVPAYAWIILFVALLAGVTAPLNQFKVPPLMPVLMQRFQLDLGTVGLLMTIFAITGFILALPAGVILQRLGPKTAGLIALSCLIAGSALGALSNSAELLLATRLIEGAGMGLIAVVAPALISIWFPPEKQGAPMGIWVTWVPLGRLIIFNLAPAVEKSAGWQAVWWIGAAFGLVAFILYGLLVRMPSRAVGRPQPGAQPRHSETSPNLRQALAGRNIWLLGLSFACFNLILVGTVSTFFPTFLTTERGYNLGSASFITSIPSLVVVAAAPLAGCLSDRLGIRKPFLVIPSMAVAVFMLFPFSLNGWLIPAAMILLGILAGFIPTATFSAVSEVMGNPQLAGIGMGVIMLGQNFGQLLGPVIFGRLVETIGWVKAGYWMIPAAAIGIVAAWLTRMD